jgi:hypothetical protein
MTLTPKQMFAYLEFGEQVDRMTRANNLVIGYVGAQGDKKAIDAMLKELGAP